MSRLRLWITMSLDGLVAGPDQDARLTHAKTVAAPGVTHLKFTRP